MREQDGKVAKIYILLYTQMVRLARSFHELQNNWGALWLQSDVYFKKW